MKFTNWMGIDVNNMPPENEYVNTRIDDKYGIRNEQYLRRQGRMWFTKSGMYVYYNPTHWQSINSQVKEDKK